MSEGPGSAMIALERVSKSFGEPTPAVDDVTIEIAGGEFFSLLGPSGCGKTTSLRMIAGFEQPDSGRVLIDGEDVSFVPARRRAVHMVFQDYALFPHMTVAENVAFGLKLRRAGREETASRVAEALGSMQLEGLGARRPAQLSGGQRQRVALARALVNRPAALLLDEPLGALDLKLRKEMQLELKAIQQRTATTFVYVTHDQEEALTMSDRIAVMCDGRVEQIDTPRRLYEHPATPFVADFIGVSNTLTLRVDRREQGLVVMELGEGSRLAAPDPGDGRSRLQVTVRPEKITLAAASASAADSGCRLRGRLLELVYMGSLSQARVEAETGERMIVNILNSEDQAAGEGLAPGAAVELRWRPTSSYVIGAAGGPTPEGDGPERAGVAA